MAVEIQESRSNTHSSDSVWFGVLGISILYRKPMQNTRKQVVGELPVTVWSGCYDSNWNSVIVDEAFAHP